MINTQVAMITLQEGIEEIKGNLILQNEDNDSISYSLYFELITQYIGKTKLIYLTFNNKSKKNINLSQIWAAVEINGVNIQDFQEVDSNGMIEFLTDQVTLITIKVKL
ncbi:hypothetical protein A9Q91_03025 [Candidatus Gracilibacteria bacterium 28_42_T64]|nr:hypothetical protein A9Q91_03025 [Candidatus Gracilibacteria bacterium 28_42_T64]